MLKARARIGITRASSKIPYKIYTPEDPDEITIWRSPVPERGDKVLCLIGQMGRAALEQNYSNGSHEPLT